MLPYMSDKSIMRPTVRTQFRGLNNNLSAQDGEITWMVNMSSREFPLLTPRVKRVLQETVSDPHGIGAQDALFWVSGDGFYYDGVRKGTVSPSGIKQFASMGTRVLIIPDKKYYDIAADTFGSMGLEQKATGVSFQNGTYAEVAANANTIYKAGAAWAFSAGDAITISGCVIHTENNKTVVIREVAGDYLRFYEDTFVLDAIIRYTVNEEGLPAGTYHFAEGGRFELAEDLSEGDTLTWNGVSLDADIGGVSSTIAVTSGDDGELLVFASIPKDYTETGEIFLAREIPDLDFICVNENRLWGCKGDGIYASALGDPFNFNVFDGLSTDSWQSSVPDEGDFTACVSFGGYPIFFKENSIYKVQGDKPSNFQWSVSSRFGVKAGSEQSLAIAGDSLFYLSRAGICIYNLGTPRIISEPLGANKRWIRAYGGTDGIRYYACMQDYDGVDHLFVFDTRYGEWHREDDSVGLFAFHNESLYMLEMTGKLWRLDGDESYGIPEDSISWHVLFADSYRFYETTDTGSERKKGPLRILIRATLDPEASVTVKIRYDDGEANTVGTINGSTGEKTTYIIPLILRRCDHYRLSLDGTGGAVIYSLSVEKYNGTAFQGSAVSLPNE